MHKLIEIMGQVYQEIKLDITCFCVPWDPAKLFI